MTFSGKSNIYSETVKPNFVEHKYSNFMCLFTEPKKI